LSGADEALENGNEEEDDEVEKMVQILKRCLFWKSRAQ